MPVPQDYVYDRILGKRDFGGVGRDLHRDDESGNPVVETVKAFQKIDNALICPERAACKRLCAWLIDFEQAPVTQGPLRRERVPTLA